MRGKECGFDAIGLGEGLANGVGISGALMYSTALARYNKTRHAGMNCSPLVGLRNQLPTTSGEHFL